jgi:hypothetical protein
MNEQTMEIRGIPLSHLVAYLVECGGEPQSEDMPIIIRGDRWEAEMLREETVTITSRFHVNAVFIRFSSDDDGVFANLMDRFRIKVMRVRGLGSILRA